MNTRIFKPTRMVVALLAAGAIGGAGGALVAGSKAQAAASVTSGPAVITSNAVSAPDFSQLAERYGAAVVNISVNAMREVADDGEDGPRAQRRGSPDIDPDDPMFEFFKRFQQGPRSGMPGRPDQRDMPVRGCIKACKSVVTKP